MLLLPAKTQSGRHACHNHATRLRALRHAFTLHLLLHCLCQSKKNEQMATLLPARLIPVSCDQLQLGMYVAELDRSWLQTSFHSHGFLLNQHEQIEELRRLCEYVYVDPVLSELDDSEMFATGLTGRVSVLAPAEHLSPLSRQRAELRALGHAFAEAVHAVRQSEALSLTPLRQALAPIVTSLVSDADTIPWLLATELKVGFLHRRALGSSVLMALAGRRIGFSQAILDELALAGLLMDIGKLSVPITILAKIQPLTTHERGFVERHVRRGLYMVRSASVISATVEDAVLGHHERLDGSGYPRGLRRTQLPLAARLAGVVDTYDAMLHDRRYARAVAPHDAMRIVNGMCEKKFDTAIVRSFMLSLGLYPTGSWVQIADGRLGIVRRQADDEPTRPHVALLSDSAGRRLPAGPVLWQPARRGDIVRALGSGAVRLPRRQLDESLSAASNLAA
jgi:HD-GYP domain-containing protein (c-di-GMP phosphodiesterase class II)